MVSGVLVGLSSRRNWVRSQVWCGSIFQSLKRGRHLCSCILSVKPRGQLTKVLVITITTVCKISFSFFQVVKLAFALNTRHLRKGKADTHVGFSENCRLLPALIPCPFPYHGSGREFPFHSYSRIGNGNTGNRWMIWESLPKTQPLSPQLCFVLYISKGSHCSNYGTIAFLATLEMLETARVWLASSSF